MEPISWLSAEVNSFHIILSTGSTCSLISHSLVLTRSTSSLLACRLLGGFCFAKSQTTEMCNIHIKTILNIVLLNDLKSVYPNLSSKSL